MFASELPAARLLKGTVGAHLDCTRSTPSVMRNWNFVIYSGRAIVVPEQSAQVTLAANSADLLHRFGPASFGRTGCGLGDCAIAQPLMGTMPVVEFRIVPLDMIEVAQAEAYEVIQAFALELPDPGLREGVGVGSQKRGPDVLSAGFMEEMIKCD